MTTPDLAITIGPDGRVLFHDLTLDLLPVAAALAPDDPHVVQRRRAGAALAEDADGDPAREAC